MNISGDIKELKDGLLVTEYKNISDSVSISAKKGSNGLFLHGENGNYTIEYGTKSDFFRSMALLDGMLKRGDNKIELKEAKGVPI